MPAKAHAKRQVSQGCLFSRFIANTRPASRNPEKGNQSAAMRRVGSRNSDRPSAAAGAVVLMLRVEVVEISPELGTVAGVREQVGAFATLGETEQLRETDPLKPASDVTVTIAVAN